MKTSLSLILALTLGCTLGLQAQRSSSLINDNWNFRFAHQVNGAPQRVELPHTWNAQDALSGKPDYARTVGVYERKLKMRPEWQGKRVFIRFEGANEVATLFIDSRCLGEHRGGYGAFVFDITDYLADGKEHTLTAKVNNALNLDIMPLVGDFNMYGGIYRDVNLIATDPLHISLTDYASPGVYLAQLGVDEKRADVEATVVVDNQGASTAKGKVRITVNDGDKRVISREAPFNLAPDSTKRVAIDFTIKNPHLWNGREDPHIYTAIAEVIDAQGRVTDRVEQPLGLRYYSTNPDTGFSLNGKPLRLKGVNRHQDRAERGNALLPMHHDEDAEIIVEMGANAARLAHYPQADYFYDLMDKNGIVVWAEIPFIGPGGYHDRGYNDLPAFRENGKEQLREMIRQHFNHPSICFWGLFNELKTHGDNPTEYIVELNEIAHNEDPSRPTTAASFLDAKDPINDVTDNIAWNKYYGWYGGSAKELGAWLDATHRDFPDFKIGISEYGAGASIYHQQDSLKPAIASGWWHPENFQTAYHMDNWQAIAERPYVWGSFIWNLFDFGAAHRTEGDRPGINDKGLVTFDRKVKKDAYYYYKANWNQQDPFVYIAERRNTRRTTPVTTVMVFSNQPEVTLTLNGSEIGTKASDGYATFRFEGVELQPGANTVTVSAPGVEPDTVVWNLGD